MYTLRLLGSATLEGLEGPLSGYPAQPRQIALLALLACAGDVGVSRDKLLACLWPDAGSEPARHALADAVYRLRKALGHDAVLGHSTALRLNPRVVRCDVVEFRTALANDDTEAAAGLFRGAFLDGFHLRNSSEFEHWMDAEARNLANEAEAALDDLAGRAEAAGDSASAASWLRRLWALDPYNSRTVMRLMEVLAGVGDRANALMLAGEHAAILAAELGVEPPAELRTLGERLRTPDATAAPPEPAPLPVAPAPFGLPSAASLDFAGRRAELSRLQSSLDDALAGDGGVVFITGEAGTGKTALAAEFCRRSLERVPDLVVAGGNGNAHTGPGDPGLLFREVLDMLAGGVEARYAAGSLPRDQAVRLRELLPLTARAIAEIAPDLLDTFIRSDELEARLRRRAAEAAPRASFLKARSARAAGAVGAAPQAALFDQYVRLLRSIAKEKPLLLVLDDLQWADSASVGLLFQLARSLGGHRILILGAYRHSDIAPGRDGDRHPLQSVVNELTQRSGDLEIALEEAGDREFVEALVDTEPNMLDAEFRDALFRRTGGHALFTVELLRAMRDRGMLVRGRGRWQATERLDWSILPPRMHAVLEERIGRLPEPLRRVLSVASVEGEVFALEIVADVTGVPVDALLSRLSSVLERQLHLVRAHGIRQVAGRRVSEYRFRHNLFQRYLYDELDAIERAYLHEQVGEAWEARLGECRDEAALALGRHFREAGMADRAATYLWHAGNRAERAGAFPEAVAHFESALEQLLTLPPSAERDRRELEIQSGLGIARIYTAKPDMEGPLGRARALAEKLNDDPLLFRALTGLYIARAHYPSDNRLGRELADAALDVAQRTGDRALLAVAHVNVGMNASMRGDFRTSLDSARQAELLYDPAHPVPWMDPFLEPGPSARCLTGEALCLLGFPDQARACMEDAVSLAGRTTSPGTLLLLRWYEAMVLLWRQDCIELYELSRTMAQSVREQGLDAHYGPVFRIPLGWSEAHLGKIDEGIATLRQAHAEWVASGFVAGASYFTALWAEALRLGGRAAEGLDLLDESVSHSTAIDEMWQEPEIRRIRGDLLLALPQPDAAGAETAYRAAIDLARTLDARWLELRATTSLARLLRSQGRSDEARPMLAELYGWFTEGFGTADLQDARRMLAEMG